MYPTYVEPTHRTLLDEAIAEAERQVFEYGAPRYVHYGANGNMVVLPYETANTVAVIEPEFDEDICHGAEATA